MSKIWKGRSAQASGLSPTSRRVVLVATVSRRQGRLGNLRSEKWSFAHVTDLRYMILPMGPADREGISEEALVGLVTRDSLIGVTEPRAG